VAGWSGDEPDGTVTFGNGVYDFRDTSHQRETMKKDTVDAEGKAKPRHMFRALGHRNFRLFFGGQSISLIGTWMQRTAMSWLVYRLTDSAVLLGLVAFSDQIPTFFLSPLAGVFIDRWNRHRVLIVTQTLALLQALTVAALILTGTIAVWHIIISSLFLGTVNAFDMPTRQAFVVKMVDDRNDLANAIALNSSMVHVARMVGPSAAGIIVGAFGEGVCFLINAVSYIAVILSLLLMNIVHIEPNGKRVEVLEGLKEGFNYAFGFAPIRAILLLVAWVSLLGMPFMVLMPVFARDILHGGPRTLGFLMGASGMGALTAALYLASRRTVLGLGRKIAMACALLGCSIIAFSQSRSFWLSIIFLFVAGFGMISQITSSNTIIQTLVEDDKRGRVMSIFSMAFMGMVPFGCLLEGTLASHLGASNTLLINSACCILAAFLFARKLPSLAEIVRPIYVKMGIIREY
jgi:MFS family permease